MGHIAQTPKHTLVRNGKLYINRRVPDRHRPTWGKFVRIRIDDAVLAEKVNERLSVIFSSEDPQPKIDLRSLADSLCPKSTKLLDVVEDYLAVRNPVTDHRIRHTVSNFVSIAGNLDLSDYSREDGRTYVAWMLKQGVKTTTVKNRINVLAAVFNYGFDEHEIEKRMPFARMRIQHLGHDSHTRVPFSKDELKTIYREASRSDHPGHLLLPIMGETGMRLMEAVGLRTEDVDLKGRTVSIRPHPLRRLKTKGSERIVPLVGQALESAERLMEQSEGQTFLQPDLIERRERAKNLSKHLKRRYGGKTCHCFRHAFRDRLREVMTPLEMIDELGGWSSINTAGSGYGRGYNLDQKRQFMEQIAI